MTYPWSRCESHLKHCGVRNGRPLIAKKVVRSRTGRSIPALICFDNCVRNSTRARIPCRLRRGCKLDQASDERDSSCTSCVCSLFATPRRVRREMRAVLMPRGTFRLRHLLPSVACLSLTPETVPQLCFEIRLKNGVRRADGRAVLDSELLIRYPQLTLRFWLYEPISKAIFKIIGPLALVLALMLVSYIKGESRTMIAA